MEISLVNESRVTHRGNTEVPPPMILIASSVLSMEYKWTVSCHPEVTLQPSSNAVSAAKLDQIDQIMGNLNLKLVVTVLEGYPSANACVWIADVDSVLLNIFLILNMETDEFCVEISYLGQILLFHRFKYIVRPADATETAWIKLSSDPPPKITPFEAWLLKTDNIRTEDFCVTVSMRIDNVE